MEHILILDATGRVVFSQLEAECDNNCFAMLNGVEKCSLNSKLRKKGKLSLQNGTIFLCTDDPDKIKSKRVFQKTIQFYGEMLASYIDIRDEVLKRTQIENNRLIHNLTTLNSHIIQEIYNIAPMDALTGGPKNQISELENAISSNPKKSAHAALKILKNAIAGRAEMQIVRRLRSGSMTSLNQRVHNIHKVVKNVLITFFQDFQEKRVQINLGDCHINVLFDYECLSVALYRLFENSIKYCKENSIFQINFEEHDRHVYIYMKMESLPILLEEKEAIFDEGVSGKAAINAKQQRVSWILCKRVSFTAAASGLQTG